LDESMKNICGKGLGLVLGLGVREEGR
jgi:hypothetical protein